MPVNPQAKLLVTGASGQMGRRVVELLLEAGVKNIIATTRSPEKLADLAARGVDVRQANFDDLDNLVKAFSGAERLLLISTEIPIVRQTQHLNAVKAAQQAGVKHVVYTSLPNPGPESPVLLAPDHYLTEQALEQSGLGWTILRNNIYADLQLGSLARAIQSGQLFAAAGEGKIAYVTREDCARAAAGALNSDFEGHRIMDVTGPEALSQQDLADVASSLSGKTVTYVPLKLEDLIQGMVGAGLPREAAEVYASFDTGTAAGQFANVTDTVEQLTGHKPTRFADFVNAHRDEVLGNTAAVH